MKKIITIGALLAVGTILVAQYTPPGGSGGAAVWGMITGTLSSQSDLNSALALKAPLASPTLTNLSTVGVQSAGIKFTASGCTNSTLVGGATAGRFTSGDSGGSCSIVVTMGSSATAANGWACSIQDQTSPAKVWGQSATSTTTATFLSPGVTTSAEVVNFSCMGY